MTENEPDVLEELDVLLHELFAARDAYEELDQSFTRMVQLRDQIIDVCNREYYDPLSQLQSQKAVAVNDENEEEAERIERDIVALQTDPNIIDIRRQAQALIKAVERTIQKHSEAGVKFRRARKKFMIDILGKEYW